MTPAPLKIYIYVIEGVGHLMACLGLGQALAQRGHRVSYLFADKMAGQLAKFGFEEILLSSKEVNNNIEEKSLGEKENPLKKIGNLLLSTGFLGPASPIEKMRHQLANGMDAFFKELFDALPEYNVQIEAAIKKGKPDFLIVDSTVVPPAILQAPVPWALLASAQPLCILPKKGTLIPFGAG